VSAWQKSDRLYSELKKGEQLGTQVFIVTCYSAVITLGKSRDHELDTNFRSAVIEHNTLFPHGSA